MTLEIRDYACSPPGTFKIGDVNTFTVPKTAEGSPIDEFFSSMAELLNVGSEPALETAPVLGKLIFIGMMSATENYFRAVLSRCLNLCPISMMKSSEKSINLGGVLWHGRQGNFSRSAFDHLSFADHQTLTKTFKEFLGLQMETAEFRNLLTDYEKLCQLRHAVVHADGDLPGRNAVKLELYNDGNARKIRFQFLQLQESALSLDNLVRLTNVTLFDLMCLRWATDWRKRTDWTGANEEALFASVWQIFHSRVDLERRMGRSKIKKAACKEKVKAVYLDE